MITTEGGGKLEASRPERVREDVPEGLPGGHHGSHAQPHLSRDDDRGHQLGAGCHPAMAADSVRLVLAHGSIVLYPGDHAVDYYHTVRAARPRQSDLWGIGPVQTGKARAVPFVVGSHERRAPSEVGVVGHRDPACLPRPHMDTSTDIADNIRFDATDLPQLHPDRFDLGGAELPVQVLDAQIGERHHLSVLTRQSPAHDRRFGVGGEVHTRADEDLHQQHGDHRLRDVEHLFLVQPVRERVGHEEKDAVGFPPHPSDLPVGPDHGEDGAVASYLEPLTGSRGVEPGSLCDPQDLVLILLEGVHHAECRLGPSPNLDVVRGVVLGRLPHPLEVDGQATRGLNGKGHLVGDLLPTVGIGDGVGRGGHRELRRQTEVFAHDDLEVLEAALLAGRIDAQGLRDPFGLSQHGRGILHGTRLRAGSLHVAGSADRRSQTSQPLAAAAASPCRPPTTSISRPARSGAAVVVVEEAVEEGSAAPISVAWRKRLTASFSFSGSTTT